MARFLLTGSRAGKTMALGSFYFRDGVCVIDDNRGEWIAAMTNLYVRFYGVQRDPAEQAPAPVLSTSPIDDRRAVLDALPLNEARAVARVYGPEARTMKKAEVIELILSKEFVGYVPVASVARSVLLDAESGSGAMTDPPTPEGGVVPRSAGGGVRLNNDITVAPAPSNPA